MIHDSLDVNDILDSDSVESLPHNKLPRIDESPA